VHITQGDHEGKAVIVSWVTADEPGSSTVIYWPEDGTQKDQATGQITTYNYYNYTSGDLGQTYDSNTTLTHYEMNPEKGESVLYVGDLSYADHYPFHDNRRWDSWGRFVERSVAYQPWIWTAGNHELDYVPSLVSNRKLNKTTIVLNGTNFDFITISGNMNLVIGFPYMRNRNKSKVGVILGESKPFKPFLHRYRVPFEASGSTEPLWYSIKRASAYIIVLSSYSAYGTYTPQYMWLMEELPKVNRSETPWLIVLMHSPWYNSNTYHYMEGETMRVMFESWFVQYKVDVVFAGHERISNIAYNIVNGECTPVHDQNAPVYITIGDGGNIEGLATEMTDPQPKYSAFREASFGHATMAIKNRTHAYYSWHRNVDGYAVKSDSM
ncbi:Iron/zinc purple acid phosphatase-like C-terminal domain-containing protein, partial [Cynara cardunculus var. scolymus]